MLGRASQHDAATITGPLDRQIRDAVSFARRNTRVAARKSPGRVDMPQYSPRAVFEAVVNAAVHRDYSIADAKIRLFLFDDRLELYSPGALPNTLPIDAMHQRQATRNETLASLLRMLEVGDVHGAGDRQYYLEQRGEGVPIIYEETRALTGSEPVYELIGGAELLLRMPSARPPVPGIQGEVSVSAEGRPLGGATILALYPNKTWMMEETDSFGRVQFDFHSEVPITVFCAAPAHRATCRTGLASAGAPVGRAGGVGERRVDGDSRANRPLAGSDRAAQPNPRQPRSHVSVRYQRRHRRRPPATGAFQAGRGRCA